LEERELSPYICQVKQKQHPEIMNTYATIAFNGSKTYMVVLGCGTCVFVTTSKVKAENRLARILKDANAN
jgi:hypothetical protein